MEKEKATRKSDLNRLVNGFCSLMYLSFIVYAVYQLFKQPGLNLPVELKQSQLIKEDS